MTKNTIDSVRIGRWALPALFAICSFLLIGGILLYQAERQYQLHQVGSQLQAISELKSEQITNWRNERIADGQVLAESEYFIAAVDAFLQGKTNADGLRRRMTSLKNNYRYSDILLLDANGDARLSLNARNIAIPDSIHLVLEVSHHIHRATLSDLHIAPDNGQVHADVVVPLQSGQGNSARRVGTLLMQIDPSVHLFPILNAWPHPSLSAETLLVRRDGDHVLFLNELRQRSGTALRLRLPDSRQDIPSVMAVFGGIRGIVEGVDYEGSPVLASIQPVPETSWYMVAKIARDEALAEWQYASRLIIALTAGLLLTALIASAFVYQRRGLRRYRMLFETEAATRAEHQRFQVAFNSSPLCASITRVSDGRIVDANDNFLSNFGWRRNEMIGLTSMDVGLWPNTEIRQTFLDSLGPDGRVINHESIWKDHDGKIHHVEISASLIDIAGTTHILAFTADVTERRLAQAELEHYRRRLEAMVDERTYELAIAKEHAERASRAKSSFLANMSHEIRTPLNAVIGLTHLLLRDSDDPHQQERLGRITEAARHLLNVINDILDISKIEAEKLELEETDFSTQQVIDETLKMVEFKARDKGLALIAEISPDLPPGLHGDPLRVQQILLNFLTNAVKFTERGHVRLRVRVVSRQDSEIMLRCEVEDTGVGIPATIRPRLFKPFEQADDSTTRHFGGTGLGLAICRRLAQKMGGEAGVDSTPGEGSTFWVTLRLQLAKHALIARNSTANNDCEAEIRETRSSARILLAEDNPLNQEVALDMLAHAGLIADLAEDGQQAVAMASETDYDLILMDIQMPVMNGLEAARTILALPGRSTATIVAMTANAFTEDRLACLAAGMVDHLAKPVEPAALHDLLLRWLPATELCPPASAVTPPLEVHVANGPEKIVSQLTALPGFDTVTGLASLNGKPDKYVKLLEHYLQHHTDVDRAIRQALDNGDYPAVRHQAHTLKGAAAALGLSDTRQAAAELEQAVRHEEPLAKLETLFADLSLRHAAQREALAGVLGQSPVVSKTADQNPENALPILRQIGALLAEDNIRSIELARDNESQLRSLLGKDYALMIDHLETFDFPAALKIFKHYLAAHPELAEEATTWH